MKYLKMFLAIPGRLAMCILIGMLLAVGALMELFWLVCQQDVRADMTGFLFMDLSKHWLEKAHALGYHDE